MTEAESIETAASSIKIENIWYLLLYAWDMVRWKGKSKSAVEKSPELLGLLATVLTDATQEIIRYQLDRAYTKREAILAGIRGKVDFASSLKLRTFDRGRTSCSFSDLTVDSLKNRIIRGTLDRLLSDPRLVHANSTQSFEKDLKHRIRRAVRALEGVTLVPIDAAIFARVQLSPSDRIYALPLAICSLIYRLQMPAEVNGDRLMVALLKDKLRFYQLFEDFIRNFYKIHLKSHRVQREVLSWGEVPSNSLVPQMRTDITVIERAPPYSRMVVDTKYSTTTLTDRKKFKSENLYQIYAYLRTQEGRGPAFENADAMLMYPTTETDVDSTMSVQGHSIRVVTVNLSRGWQEIEAQLLSLIPLPPSANSMRAEIARGVGVHEVFNQ